jgi:hypothetical protein
MWGTVLVLALVAATDPVRLGIAVLLISRPRPMLNLLAFWFGGMAMGIAAALGVLILLRDSAPMFMQNVASTAASSTIGQIRIAMGVLALLTAVLVAVGFSARQRARAPMPSGDPSALALQPSTQTAFSRLSARAQDTLDSGSLGVAFLAGIGMATPPALYLAALVAILASGAAISTQVSAAVMFTVVAFAVVEIPLVSQLAAPTKTHAVMLQLHDWVRARRRRILATIIAFVGVYLVTTGMGV